MGLSLSNKADGRVDTRSLQQPRGNRGCEFELPDRAGNGNCFGGGKAIC